MGITNRCQRVGNDGNQSLSYRLARLVPQVTYVFVIIQTRRQRDGSRWTVLPQGDLGGVPNQGNITAYVTLDVFVDERVFTFTSDILRLIFVGYEAIDDQLMLDDLLRSRFYFYSGHFVSFAAAMNVATVSFV